MSTTDAKLGRAVGPVLPYENIRHISNSDDHRRHAHDVILPPQSTSSFLGKNQENCRIDSEMEKVKKPPLNSTNGLSNNIETKAQAQQYTPAKLNHGKSTDMNSKPYYQVEEKAGTLSCQIGIDAELLSAQSQFVAAGAVAIAAAAHREVGAVHLGLT